MIWQFSSPLLLFPEWLILLLIALQIGSLWCAAGAWRACSKRSDDAGGSGELSRLREDYSRLWGRHEALRENYADLWREHQETCDILGPLLPEDEKTPESFGRVS